MVPIGPIAEPIAPSNKAPTDLNNALPGDSLKTNTLKKKSSNAPTKGILLMSLVNPLPSPLNTLNNDLPPTLRINLRTPFNKPPLKVRPKTLVKDLSIKF